MLADGIVHLLASDGHNLTTRAPLLSEGSELAGKLVGTMEAEALNVDIAPRIKTLSVAARPKREQKGIAVDSAEALMDHLITEGVLH